LNEKETRVPYKILSFDIEASSSHGDFPVPIKSYKKLATNIVDYFSKNNTDLNIERCKTTLREIIKTAFGFSLSNPVQNIDTVYPKIKIVSEKELHERTENWLKTQVRERSANSEEHLIESLFENANKAFQVVTEAEHTAGDADEDEDGDANSDNGVLEEEPEKYFKIGSGFKTELIKTNNQQLLIYYVTRSLSVKEK
jgi:hypothetical protein